MPMELLDSELFYSSNRVLYPSFKKGLYMEEYFFEYMKKNNITHDKNGRQYIPVLWTNFQIENWFNFRKGEMQDILNKYIEKNPCSNGYFTVVQYDDGPLLELPKETIVYGACSGSIQLPLIYQDLDNKLERIQKKSFKEKSVLCSFIGRDTHNVRNKIINYYKNNPNFCIINNSEYRHVENAEKEYTELTINSKFTLAPRGYGRSSFRFFEIFKLDSIPIYVWDDIEWLPYKERIDYSKFCISIHIDDLDKLESIIVNIDEEKYNEMLDEFKKVKDIFELEYMCEYIIS
jgi:hypothetical protein